MLVGGVFAKRVIDSPFLGKRDKVDFSGSLNGMDLILSGT